MNLTHQFKEQIEALIGRPVNYKVKKTGSMRGHIMFFDCKNYFSWEEARAAEHKFGRGFYSNQAIYIWIGQEVFNQ